MIARSAKRERPKWRTTVSACQIVCQNMGKKEVLTGAPFIQDGGTCVLILIYLGQTALFSSHFSIKCHRDVISHIDSERRQR